MKKRILAFLTATVCLVMFAACNSGGGNSGNSGGGGSKEADTASIMANINKNKELKQVDMTVSVKTDAQGQKSNTTLHLQSDTRDESKTAFMTTGKIDNGGTTLDVSMFYKDGYYYTEAMGMKTKQKMSASEAAEKNTYAKTAEITITEEMLKAAESKKDGDNTVYTLNYSDEGNTMSVTGEITINGEGYLVKYNVKTDVKSGDTVTSSTEMNIEYKDPGKDITIDYPKDLDSYKAS